MIKCKFIKDNKYIFICLLEIAIPILLFLVLKYSGSSDPIALLAGTIGSEIVALYILIKIAGHHTMQSVKKNVKKYITIIPTQIKKYFDLIIREKVGNEENTYSLFWGFNMVDVQNLKVFNKEFVIDELSLNGLVGENNQEEKVSTHITDDEIENYLDIIKKWRGNICIGNNHLIENDEEKEDYARIFTKDNIRHFIKVVNDKTKEKDNTFNFIADQYGIYTAEKDKRGNLLTLYVYKTNYFTFRVMNYIYENTPILHSIAKKMCLFHNNDALRNEGFRLLFPFFASLGTNIIIEFFSQQKGKGFLIQKRNDKVFGSAPKYHISVNETFSFTDNNEGCPDIQKCVKRGIEEELGLNLEKEYKEDTGHKRITYMDIFLNPDRGSIGLSVVYKTDTNPSLITYYPGTDKVIEASKHFCVYGVDNYTKMLDFISLYNWIVYTPYLLKQYAISKQGWLGKLMMIWNLDRGEKLFCEKRGLFWITCLYHLSTVALLVISIYYLFYQKSFLASIICLPIFGLWEEEIFGYFRKRPDRKIQQKNIDYCTPGDYPYNNVLLYTGIDEKKNLESKHITLALKSSINTTFDKMLDVLRDGMTYDFYQYFKTVFSNNIPTIVENEQMQDNKGFQAEASKPIEISWDTVNIISCRTGIRHISKDEEYPALVLQGYVSSHNNGGKQLVIRQYYIEQKATKYIVYYYDETEEDEQKEDTKENTEDNKTPNLIFGYKYPFSSVFDIIRTSKEERQNMTQQEIDIKDSNLSLFATEILQKNGYNCFGYLKVKTEMEKDLHLCDIYQSPDKKEIIISSYLEKEFVRDKKVKKIEGNSVDICNKILNLINNDKYIIDKQDILMLQQILLRKRFDIKLFYQKKKRNEGN